MAIKFHNPPSVSLAGKYSLGAEVPQGARLFYVSGQVGVDSKGKLQAGIEKQVEQVWKNIAATRLLYGWWKTDLFRGSNCE